jgi:hypothetical protein
MKKLSCLIVSILLLLIAVPMAKADWIDDMYLAGEIPFTVAQCLHDGTCDVPEEHETRIAFNAGAFTPVLPGIMAPFTWPELGELPDQHPFNKFKDSVKGSVGLIGLGLIAWMITHPEEVKRMWNEFVQMCQDGGINVPIMPVY